MSHIETLANILTKAPDEVFVQPHNVPDPDAIASSFGLQYLLAQYAVPSVIVYENEIEKANSQKMLDIFGISMKHAQEVQTLGEEDWTVLVDVQKKNANYTDLVTDEVAVIDHHSYNGPQGYRYEDVREDVGACASIIASYFHESGTDIPRLVATALFYGILMDTDGLTRGVSQLDINMFYHLYKHTDFSLIHQLKANEITHKDLHAFSDAFRTVEVYGNIGFFRLDSPDDSLLGSASDIVMTIADVNIVVAYSIRKHGVKLSTRSIDDTVRADLLVVAIVQGVGVGGGHEGMAGGFIEFPRFPNNQNIDTYIRYKTIQHWDQPCSGKIPDPKEEAKA
jgi:nanoRNase/pAp phosphatase (c-di-AMP/oligoRNAs hydrolase)